MIKFTIKMCCVLVFLCCNSLKAQEFYGQAVYETKRSTSGFRLGDDMPEEMKKKMEANMKKAFEKTYILDFNKYESVYYQEVKLESPTVSMGNGMNMSNANDDKRYKNVKENLEIFEHDIFGKEFLVQDSLPKWDWKLQEETKKIGDYTCYKAIQVIPVSDEEKKEYENNKNNKDSKTKFIEISEPKEKTITVWYTPEIPIAQGPEKFWGLPGLILEANDGSTSFLCSKIILNPKDKTTIKRPTKGKKVTRKQFEEIEKKQIEKMTDANGVIHINVGGH